MLTSICTWSGQISPSMISTPSIRTAVSVCPGSLLSLLQKIPFSGISVQIRNGICNPISCVLNCSYRFSPDSSLSLLMCFLFCVTGRSRSFFNTSGGFFTVSPLKLFPTPSLWRGFRFTKNTAWRKACHAALCTVFRCSLFPGGQLFVSAPGSAGIYCRSKPSCRAASALLSRCRRGYRAGSRKPRR